MKEKFLQALLALLSRKFLSTLLSLGAFVFVIMRTETKDYIGLAVALGVVQGIYVAGNVMQKGKAKVE